MLKEYKLRLRWEPTRGVSARRCTPLKSRGVFSEKSESEDFHVYRRRKRSGPHLCYLLKTTPNASAGIGRPPSRRRTAVPGRTALSRIAVGWPFKSNLTALSGE